jgi:hypothetical protein
MKGEDRAQKEKIMLSERQKHVDFLAYIGYLDDVAEQYVLRTLINNNSAQAKKTIRNYLVLDLAAINKKRIWEAHYLNDGLLSSLYSEFGRALEYSGYLKEFVGKQYRTRITESSIKEDRICLDLLRAYIPDDQVIKSGYSPLSITEKVEVLEKIMRNEMGIAIPSWEAIKSAVKQLEDAGLIIKREVSGKRSSELYYVAPQLYQMWENQREKINERRQTIGGRKTRAEEFWFPDN